MSDFRATRRALGSLAGAAALAATIRPARAATKLRIGLLHTLSPAPLYLAMERGYFAAEGLEAEFRFFEAAQPIAAAAVAGDIDIGITALTGGFFALAGRGALKVIAGGLHEQKGYEGSAVLASPKAYEAGLTGIDKLGGRSFAITQFGSSFHYMLGRLAETAHFDLKSVTLRPVQEIGNMVAAVRSNQVDATIAIASMAKPLEAAGAAKIIGWVGDLVPYQITAVFAASRIISGRAQDVGAFARAYQRGVAEFRAAFLLPNPVETDRAIADIKKYVFTGDPDGARKIRGGVGWYDEGAGLDVADVTTQIRWFTEQGLVKVAVDPAEVIDTRFIPPLRQS